MVAGDFTGLNKAGRELIYEANVHNDNNNAISDADNKKTDLLNTNLVNLGFFSSFESNLTSFSRDQVCKSNSDVYSSCNILCRERMPSTKTAFLEALYRTKSPLSIYNQEVPFEGEKLCGYYGVVREGLCHMAIPRGWVWGGPASEHLPIWVEVYKTIDRTSSSVSAASTPTPTPTPATTPSFVERSTDSMRRRLVRRNSLNSCRSLKIPSSTVALDARNKLERGATITTMCQSNANNCDGNSVFYDADYLADDINRSNSSSSSSVHKSPNF